MSHPAPRGRPRDEQVTRAILDATMDILSSEGSNGLSIEAVARRAGVSRPSIYKRWPTIAALLLDATLDARQRTLPPGTHGGRTFPTPDTGSLTGDLQELAHRGAALFGNLERGGVIQALLAEAIRSEEVASRLEENVLVPDETALQEIFQRAAGRGEWPAAAGDATDEDWVLVLRALIAHAIFERYILHRPFDEIRTSRLAEILARGSEPDS